MSIELHNPPCFQPPEGTSDEDYVWMLNIWLSSIYETNENEILNRFLGLGNLRQVKDFLLNDTRDKPKEFDEFHQKINTSKTSNLNQTHLKEIKDNERAIWFSIYYLIKKYNIDDIDLTFQDAYLYFLYLIHVKLDSTNISEVDKDLQNSMDMFKSISSQKINLDRYIDDNDFIEWAYDYIRKVLSSHEHRIACPMNYSIFSLPSKKMFILNYFDNLQCYEYKTDCYHVVLINKLKKAWQQKKFRNQKKTKKPYHIPLTKGTKSNLSKLAKFKNTSENAVLEKLINEAYLNEMCDENGQLKY